MENKRRKHLLFRSSFLYQGCLNSLVWSGTIEPQNLVPQDSLTLPNVSMKCKVDLDNGMREFSSRPFKASKNYY